MKLTWFSAKGEPSRGQRVTSKKALEDIRPTVDEITARAAQEIMENHAFTRVFDNLRQSALADMSSSQMGMAGLQAREEAHTRIKSIDKIQEELQSMADQLKLYRKKEAVPEPIHA